MSENQKAGWSFCRKDAMIIAHSPVLSFKLSRKKIIIVSLIEAFQGCPRYAEKRQLLKYLYFCFRQMQEEC